MSRSSSRIWPLSGCRCALIRLTSVVLPAPFDPTSDRNSPLCTTKSRPSQARVSPNCFLKFTVLSRITSGLPSCQALTELGNGAHDAGRPGEGSGDEKGDPAKPADPDPEKTRTDLVVANGLQRLAERRVHDYPHQDDADHEDGEHVVIIR